MTVEEFEALLEGAAETDALEFKAAMSWSASTLVRDILALSNVEDGGTIVIGIEDETWKRQGLSAEQFGTFNEETMRDAVAPYADPEVIFSVEFPRDSNGLTYALIKVAPFREMPVICKRDGPDVQRGTIYFRSRAQRPQSARVSTEYDMRGIIERAIVRRGQSLRRIGFVVPPADEASEKYESELGDL